MNLYIAPQGLTTAALFMLLILMLYHSSAFLFISLFDTGFSGMLNAFQFIPLPLMIFDAGPSNENTAILKRFHRFWFIYIDGFQLLMLHFYSIYFKMLFVFIDVYIFCAYF